jgi:hypothetical protein
MGEAVASKASISTGSDDRGQDDNGTSILTGVSNVVMVWSLQLLGVRSTTDPLTALAYGRRAKNHAAAAASRSWKRSSASTAPS